MPDNDYQPCKRGRKPMTAEQRIAAAERKRQRERERYRNGTRRTRQADSMAKSIASGLDSERIQAGIGRVAGNGKWENVLHHVSNDRDLGRIAAAVEHRGTSDQILPDADRRAVYKRLIAIGMVEPYDYADKDGRALKLHELSPVARQAAQMVRDGDMIIVEPPSQKMQLEAIKLLGQTLALKDIASMTAEIVAGKMVVAVQDSIRQPGSQAIIDADMAEHVPDSQGEPVTDGYEDL